MKQAGDLWGVVFDMDGVLVDSAEPHFESWQRLAREEGITITRRQFEGSFGRQNRDIVPEFFGRIGAERLEAIANRKEALYREIVRAKVPAVDGAVELVRALSEAGVPLAIGSAGPRANIDLIVEGMGVGRNFAAIVSADDVTRGKPDPQVFQLACERLGLPARRCVVIEDAPPGVVAGKGAGAKVAAIMMHHSRETLRTAGADIVVGKLKELSVDGLRKLVAA